MPLRSFPSPELVVAGQVSVGRASRLDGLAVAGSHEYGVPVVCVPEMRPPMRRTRVRLVSE